MKRIVITLLFIASSASAEIYKWTDSKGTVHFTNSSYEIPERYRAKAKTVDLGIPEQISGQPQPQQSPATIIPPQPTTPAAQATRTPPVEAVLKPLDSQHKPAVKPSKRFKQSRRSSDDD